MAASKDDLITAVNDFFNGSYTVTNGTVVPDIEDLSFGKVGKEIELAMMFIDIRESTKIVDGLRRVTAAKLYKSFLWGVSQIARVNGGELRSFNGDGVLMAFIGESKCTSAVKAAMQMSWFIQKILKPKIDGYIVNNEKLGDLNFDFGIGVDVGKVLVVRGGIKGENNNDLVWVGNATNYAVKLSSLAKEDYKIYISEGVYKAMHQDAKLSNGTNMWDVRSWTDLGGITIYRTNWYWRRD